MNIWTSLALTPHTLSYEQIDGVQTRILAAGPPDASPLVFLHGVSGHLEAFAHNLPAFAERYRVIAYDYPGHGYSDCPRERSYEIAGYVDHLTALLDAYDIERATLIGLSLGGWISARMAQCNPKRVERLVLVGTGGASYDESVMRTLTSLTQTAVADPSSSSVRARLEWLMHDPSTVTDELVYLRQSIYQRPDFGATVSQVLCLQQPDIRRANLLSPQDWSAIKHPCLVLWGSSDRSAPPSKGREIARMTPKGEFVELEQAGHWPQFERPASFNQAVLLWLESLNHEQRN